MKVTFYTMSGDKNSIKKQLNNANEIVCSLKQNTSMLYPVLQISKDKLANFVNVNYAYIDLFTRYYFVGNTIAAVGSIIEIPLEIDPLMSHKNSILNLSPLILRQERVYNKYYQDTQVPIRSNKTFIYKKIGVLPNVKTNILTVDGGV